MLFRTNPFNDFSIQPEKIPNSFPWPINYWALKNWCFWTVLLGKTLESPLDDGKDIKPINPKGNQSWIFIGRTDAEAEALILRPPDARNWLPGKDPDAGKDWRQEEKGMTENEVAGWHHWLNEHEFEQTSGDREEQESLECCSPLGHRESDITEPLNNKPLVFSCSYSQTLQETNTHSEGQRG